MRTKQNGQIAHIATPASGFAAALGVKMLAYATNAFIPAAHVPVKYRKRRRFNPVDAFVGEHQANDDWCAQVNTTA